MAFGTDDDVRDTALRAACFASLDKLRERCGDDLPFAELSKGFTFDGERVPFKHAQQGIYRSARQRGPAALSIATSPSSRYPDEVQDEGLWYAFERRDDVHTNRALRAAHELRVPLVYFLGTSKSWWQAVYPCFISELDLASSRVFVSIAASVRPYADVSSAPEFERRWAVRDAKVRLHQGVFRAAVLNAYAERCAICRLRERRLLDAAHIVADSVDHGIASVTNGLSFCPIHHRAFDQDLVGVSPDFRVHVSERLLTARDGPMLELLKKSHGDAIVLPQRSQEWPDRDRLAERFERFNVA